MEAMLVVGKPRGDSGGLERARVFEGREKSRVDVVWKPKVLTDLENPLRGVDKVHRAS